MKFCGKINDLARTFIPIMSIIRSTNNNRWIYTYDYAPDEVWSEWRVSMETPAWVVSEAQAVANRIESIQSANPLSFVLISDNHYTVNGTCQDTRDAIAELNKLTRLDGVIHLGDFTDGMVDRAKTTDYATIILNGIEATGLKCYAALGNHDCNYFMNNAEQMTIYEQCRLYLKRETPRYYVDCEELRLIFIDSFDPETQLRYGFTAECINWLNEVLNGAGQNVIIFSHVTPLVQLQAWTDEIRNSDVIMRVLNQNSRKILAFINGHNHCDLLYNNGEFPIISINCAKCEFFLEYKPEGAVVPYRKLGERTQESFDIMTIDSDKRIIYFTRFGAGHDRIVQNGKASWII